MVAVLEQERRKHAKAAHTLGGEPNLCRNLLMKISLYGLDGH